MTDFYINPIIFDNSAPLTDRLYAAAKDLVELSKRDNPIYRWCCEYHKGIIINKLEELLNDNK